MKTTKKRGKENRLVVGNTAWADTIPEWILKEVAKEREINAALNCMGKKLEGWEQVGDAEVVAYLLPATMAHPIDHDYVEIYIYLSSKLMLTAKKATEDALPDDFKAALKKGLPEYQQSLLRQLRSKLFQARGEVRHPIFDTLEEVFKESTGNREDKK